MDPSSRVPDLPVAVCLALPLGECQRRDYDAVSTRSSGVPARRGCFLWRGLTTAPRARRTAAVDPCQIGHTFPLPRNHATGCFVYLPDRRAGEPCPPRASYAMCATYVTGAPYAMCTTRAARATYATCTTCATRFRPGGTDHRWRRNPCVD
ncbi:hypothetical protein JCM4914_42860 [Streptomyces platensis subsp. malvinus]